MIMLGVKALMMKLVLHVEVGVETFSSRGSAAVRLQAPRRAACEWCPEGLRPGPPAARCRLGKWPCAEPAEGSVNRPRCPGGPPVTAKGTASRGGSG